MNAYIVEGAVVSSSHSLIKLQQAVQEKPYVLLGVPGMFNGEVRIEQILKLSGHHHAEKQLDELRNEHVQFAYHILKHQRRNQALKVIHQCFNILDDYLRAVCLLQELSESTIRKAKGLLQEIAAELVKHFLKKQENELQVVPIMSIRTSEIESS